MFENALTAKQIKERLDLFNETNDWSVFADVPEWQAVEVMYPFYFKADDVIEQVPKWKLEANASYGLLGSKI